MQSQMDTDELVYYLLFGAEAGEHQVYMGPDTRVKEVFNRAVILGVELGAKVGDNRIKFPGSGEVEFRTVK